MSVFKRLLTLLVVLVATAGLLLAVTVGVGVWLVKEPVTNRANWLFGRIQAAINVAEEGLEHAATSLARAATRLDEAKEERRIAAQQPRRTSTIQQMLLRRVQIAADLDDAHETLHTVAEAAVVVNSVLEDVGSFPLLSESGFDVDGLTAMNNRLAGVGPAAWELSRLLGDPGVESDPDAAGARLSRIEGTLETIQKFVGDYQTQVKQVRQRAEGLKARTLKWITPAAVLITFFCFWFAVSQISLLAHARSWWKGSACAATPTGPVCPT